MDSISRDTLSAKLARLDREPSVATLSARRGEKSGGEGSRGTGKASPAKAPSRKSEAVALTADEAALATKLKKVLAKPPKRVPLEPAPRVHVSLSNAPEDALAVPDRLLDGDLLPPPLPLFDPAELEESNGGLPFEASNRDASAANGTRTAAVASHSPAPWLARRRRRRAGVALAWSFTVAVIAAALAGASIGFFGVERVSTAAVDAWDVIQSIAGLLSAVWHV